MDLYSPAVRVARRFALRRPWLRRLTGTCRLADAGARVLKIERPEGDFARGYDTLVHGECSYFVWLNRGKDLVVLDLTVAVDRGLFAAMLKRADIFVQNLEPGRDHKLGFPSRELRHDFPR